MTIEERLSAAVKKRDSLAADKQRLEGRLESAQAALTAVESECRAKNIDPNKLDEIIQKLEARRVALVEQLEKDVEAANLALQPYIKET